MELTLTGRVAGKKALNKHMRREGNIPAVVYSKGKKGVDVIVNGAAFAKVLNTIEPGTLASQIFTLHHNGETHRAIIKDIQYAPTTYRVLHIDFEQLHGDAQVSLSIPIKCTNTVDCIGVKLGGVLRQAVVFLPVRCPADRIPARFEVDVGNLALGQALKLSDLSIPHGVHPTTDLNTVLVAVARR